MRLGEKHDYLMQEIDTSFMARYKEDKVFEIEFKKRKNHVYERLANLISTFMDLKTLRKTKEMYAYEEATGLWEPDAEDIIELIIRYVLPEISRHGVKEIIARVRSDNTTDKKFRFDKKKLLGVENGVIDYETFTLGQHEAINHITRKLPHKYDPDAECPKINQFLSEVLTRSQIEIVMRFFGYCLFPSHHIKKSLMLVGKTNTGKSTLLELLRTFLGSENVKGLTLQQISDSNFLIRGLVGKLANISADIPMKAIADTTYFKMLTGQDMLTADVKNRKEIDFVNTCKLIFSCNEIPTSYDKTKAYFDRWIPVEIEKTTFVDERPSKMNEKRAANKNKLIAELTNKDEMAGFLVRVLEYLQFLLEENQFPHIGTAEERERIMLMRSDSARAFIKYQLVEKADNPLPKKLVYSVYNKWCKKHNKNRKTQNAFNRRLQEDIDGIDEGWRGPTGKQERVWIGIDFKDPEIKESVRAVRTVRTFSASQVHSKLGDIIGAGRGKT